jgi:16S rRNA processing protein RimM
VDADAFVEIGRVSKTHGLNGEVSVIVTGGLPVERLVGLEVWFVPPPAALRSARIGSVRSGPKGPLFSLEGVSDIGAAETLRGCLVLAKASDVPEAEYEFDPVGLVVTDDAHGLVGTVEDVIVTGANDVWVVRGPYGEVLVPVIDDVVCDVDEDAMTARVTLLPGLLEEGESPCA